MTTPPPHSQPPPPARAGRKTGFGAVLLATSVWALVYLVLVLVVSGPPATPEGAGSLTAAVIMPTLLAAPFTWLAARRRAAGWRFPLLVLLALPLYLLLLVCIAVSRTSA